MLIHCLVCFPLSFPLLPVFTLSSPTLLCPAMPSVTLPCPLPAPPCPSPHVPSSYCESQPKQRQSQRWCTQSHTHRGHTKTHRHRNSNAQATFPYHCRKCTAATCQRLYEGHLGTADTEKVTVHHKATWCLCLWGRGLPAIDFCNPE